MIETRALSGHRLVVGDLDFLVEVWNDDRVAPTIGGRRSPDEIRERIARWDRHWSVHGFGTTLFRERTTGVAVGWGGLQHSTIGIGECLTVGYVIAPPAWGRGYATDIARGSVAYAFDGLETDQVHASVLSTNRSSRRVLEKAGLVVCGEVVHGNEVEVIYVISR